MCGCKAECFITLSTVIGSATVNLPESMRLRNSKIISMWMRRLGSSTATNINGQTIAPDTVVLSAYLTLKNQNGTAIHDPIPLQLLQRDFNSPEPLAINLYEQIDPIQSQITLNTSASGYVATDVIEIVFGLKCDGCGVS